MRNKQSVSSQDEYQKNIIIEKRKKMREVYYFKKTKSTLFFLGVFLSLIIIGSLFLQSDESRIRKINVHTKYLPISYVEKLSGLNEDSIFLFVMPKIIEDKLEKSPMIQTASVQKDDFNMIKMDIIEEKIVGYHMEDGFHLMLANGECIKVDEEFVDLIRYVPLFVGFFDEEIIREVATYFSDVDENIIENISEIKRYRASYDENQLQILMRDGHTFFTSYFSLDVLNYYYDILPTIVEPGTCIVVEEINKIPYTTACPWINNEDDEIKSEAGE